jgi:hypothetical protein
MEEDEHLSASSVSAFVVFIHSRVLVNGDVGLRIRSDVSYHHKRSYLHDRSLVQIKSHAQKVLKRLEAGENVFRRLEENYSVVDSLIVQAAKQRDALGAPIDTKYISTVAKRKRQNKKSSSPTVESINQEEDGTNIVDASPQPLVSADPDSSDSNTESGDGGRGAVIAAAALCQLSSLGSAWDKQQQQQAAPSLLKMAN